MILIKLILLLVYSDLLDILSSYIPIIVVLAKLYYTQQAHRSIKDSYY